MLKRVLAGAGAALLVSVAVPSVAAAQMDMAAMPKGKEYTVTGTVIDFACKFAGGLTGDKHRMCAQVCADKGVPLAILSSDGRLFLPIGDGMPSTGQNEILKDYAEQTVQVTGMIFEAGGASAIKIAEIKKAS